MGEYQSYLLILRYSIAYFWATTQTWFLKRVTELCLWIPDLWPPLVVLFQWKIEEKHSSWDRKLHWITLTWMIENLCRYPNEMASFIIFLDDCGLHVVELDCCLVQKVQSNPTIWESSSTHLQMLWRANASTMFLKTSFTTLIVGVFVVYVLHTCWVMYGIVYTKPCDNPKSDKCILPFLAGNPKLQVNTQSFRVLLAFVSTCTDVSDLWLPLSSWVFTPLCSPTQREDTPWSTKKTYLMWTASLRGLALYNK